MDNISAFFNAGIEIESDANMEVEETGLQQKYSLRPSTIQKSKQEFPKRSQKLKFTSFFYPIESQNSEVIGRVNESKEIVSMLEPPLGGMRPLLIGPLGIGKNSVIIKVMELYITLNKVANIAKKHFYCINCRKLMSEYPYENPAEDLVEYMRDLMDELNKLHKNEAVLYFRDIDTLMMLPQVSSYLQTLFEEKNSIIASIAEEIEDEKIQPILKILYRHNFSKLEIKESPMKDIYQIVENHLEHHGKSHNFLQTEDGIRLAVKLSAKHLTAMPLPIRATNAIYQCSSRIIIENALQGHNKKMTVKEVAIFFSHKTGIPEEDLLDDSIFNEKRFAAKLMENIVGQDYAIRELASHAASFKLGILNPKKPWGVFLFVGPTGVGKTELAKQLAKNLFKTNSEMITLDGSEYKESHSASNLIGAPRGYEGHDLGGMLTAPLLENPHRIVLFDEFEKAHDEVRKIFLQVFDQGVLTDRRGKKVDCSQALFLLTSNLGSSDLFNQRDLKKLEHERLIEALKPILVEHLSAEMCGRFTKIIPFMPIGREHLSELAVVELKRIRENLSLQTSIDLHWTESLIQYLSDIDVDLRFGGRLYCHSVYNLITNAIKQKINLSGHHLKGKTTLDINTKNEIIVKN